MSEPEEHVPFEPDWASAPGETVLDILEERQLAPDEFARRMSLNPDELRGLLEGALAITEELAERLSRELGSTPQFWLRREQQYRAALERLKRRAAQLAGAEGLEPS